VTEEADSWRHADPHTRWVPDGYPIPARALGPYPTWDKQGIEYLHGGPEGGRPTPDTFDPAFEEPFDYAEAVRELTSRFLIRDGADSPDLRWTEVAVSRPSRSRAGTRLIVYFHRDSEPDVTYAFWGFIWEMVTWMSLHRPAPVRFLPGRIAGEFVTYMNMHLPYQLAIASPPDEDGIRWIRLNLVW
jgi:hypothetical protein